MPRSRTTTEPRESPKPQPARGNGDLRGITDEDVARRAYEIYQNRGGSHGADLDDWLEAERQLKRGPSDVTGPTPTSPQAVPKPRRRKPEQTGL